MIRHRFILLDGIRGVAAICVVIHHSSQQTLVPVFATGYFAVDLFFCLSGFVLTQAYSNRIDGGMTFRKFILQRFIRLHPMFVIGNFSGFIVTLFIIEHHQTDFTFGSLLVSMMVNLLYLPFPNAETIQYGSNVVHASIFPSNNPSWSLFFEIWVNVLFFWLLAKTRYWKIVCVAVATLSLTAMIFAIWYGRGPLGWGWGLSQMIVGAIRSVAGFSTGMFLLNVSNYFRPRVWNSNITAFFFMIFVFGLSSMQDGRLLYAIAIVAVPFLVFYGSILSTSGMISSACEYLGELSYPLYCIHFPIIAALKVLGLDTDNESPLIFLMFSLFLSLLASHLLLRFFDRPVRLWLTRRYVKHGPLKDNLGDSD